MPAPRRGGARAQIVFEDIFGGGTEPPRPLVPAPVLARVCMNLNANVAPPGYSMLFLLASDPQPAAPCVEAKHVRIGP